MKSRTLSKGMALIGVILIFVLGMVVLPATAAPANPTALTLSEIEGLDGDVDTDFWVVDYYDTNGRGDALDPIASLAAPPTTLSGYGSTALRVEPNDGAGGSGCTRLGGKVFFGTQALNGTKLSEITEFGYSFLVDQTNGTANANNLTVYVNLFVDKNGDGTWEGANDSILVYEPLYTSGQPALDTWIDNPAIGTGATGRWHTAAQSLDGVAAGTPAAPSDLWSEIIALPATGAGIDPNATTMGDLKIVNPPAGCSGSTQGGTGTEGTGSGLALVVGQKSGADWNDFVGYIDGVYLTATGTNATSSVNNLNIIGDPVTATILSGGSQSTTVNTLFAPLVVELRDANSVLVEVGTQAMVTVPVSGASAAFTSTTASTDAAGTVTFYPTANGTTGNYSVEVDSLSGGASTFTTFTNTAAPTLTGVSVFAADVQGLTGDSTDFWKTEVYDTNASTNDPIGSIDRTPAASTGYASFEFVVGPESGTNGANPAGCTGAGGKVFFGTDKLAGLTLRDIDQLGYATLLKSVGVEDTTETLQVYVNLFIDYNNDGLWTPGADGILVYDTSRPGNLTPPYTLGQWYDIPDLTSSGSSSSWFFAVRSPFNGNIGFNQVDATVNTFQELLAYSDLKVEVVGGERLADLKIVNPFGGCTGNTGPTPATEGTSAGVVFVFGQKNGGSYNNMVAHLDTIRLVTSGGGAFDLANVYDITDYGTAATITATSGGGQSADINAAFTNPLVATVTDSAGRTIPYASVTFTAPSSGASASLGTASGMTDLFTGQFSTTATANNTIGTYNVTVNTSPALTAASFSLTNVALPPVAPTDLTATPDATLPEIDLAWTSTADGNQGDQQAIQRSPAGANTWTTLTTFGAAAESYTDTDADCSDSFDYRVRVFNSTGEAFSNVANATVPTCPADISVSAGDNQSATISTAYASPIVALVTGSDGQPFAGATVNFVAPATGASVTFSASSAVTNASGLASVTVTANGVPGTVVAVAISADIAGDAAFFTLNNTPAAPTAVTTLVATPASATSVSLAWTSTSTSSFDSYTLYRASDGVTFSAIATLAAGASSYTDTGLVCNVTYTYRVDISNSAGTAAGNTDDALTTACGELLTNGNFNADAGNLTLRAPTGWTGKNLSTSNRQKCGDDGKSFDGACYLSFKGLAVGPRGRVSQVVPVTGLVAGETLTLTASANALKGAKGTVELVVTYPNPLRATKPIVVKYPLLWNANTTGYTTQSISHTLIATPTKITVVIRSRAAKGSWLVDGVSLSKTNIGELRLPGN